ncbi:MAG: hypothetical protein SVQ76_02190 [Candidatus Nanohaloarchaea archaeon]|nr:hypothetical protein [Candidatus Nanohaloarchaea archaeon]
MKGQISIDYLAGAMIFFGSLIFLVSQMMTSIPQFSQAQQVDELELTAWSVSEILLEDRGHWSIGGSSGTDWQDHMGGVEVLGLKGKEHLSREKINALLSMSKDRIRSLLGIEEKINIQVREVVDVDTYHSFQQGGAPAFMTEPSYSDYTASEIHYGSHRFGGEKRYFLLMKNTSTGWYDNLSVSTDWDFSDPETEFYDLTDTQYLAIGDRTYVVQAGNTGISDGKLLVLTRELGRVGYVPSRQVENIVSIQRYGAMSGNIVEVVVRVW